MHTYGGGINEGMAIYDHIKGLGKKTPIDITATGACMSMGIIILQAARKRYATPNVCFMLHQLRGSNEGNLGQQRDQYQHMEKLQAKMNIILAQRTKKAVKQIDKLIDRKDYFIGAEEALKMNLIDAIV
jgi:ATP-dependent Clp endopeptidase proteolytic subunit ClpP